MGVKPPEKDDFLKLELADHVRCDTCEIILNGLLETEVANKKVPICWALSDSDKIRMPLPW